jgi:beta-lactam-binding protein with PASTA domain/predicted Ser/Thr protein kinase
MDTAVTDPLVGRLLDGRYQVDARLARGGMATVYRALDTRLDRPVALKVMHAGLAADHLFVERFIREARSAARLSHPGVVAVYDQGDDDGTVFLVMEYVPGRTLRDLLRQRGRLTPREAFDILEPVLSALAAAHDARIVHRDIKPENVLLADDGRVKVADFGLARSALTSGGSNATQGVVMGTVAYLAPEQVERGTADPRSDVYSAGILLYELLVGSPPYSGETPMAVAYQHVTSDVPRPSDAVPGLADDLDVLVQTATDRDPDGRPDDAGRMLRMVQGVRGRLTPAQLAFTPTSQDLAQTLVVPLPGAYGFAAAGAAAHPVDAFATTALPLGPDPGARTSPYAPRQPKVGGPGQIPVAASRQRGGRRVVIGLLLLALLAAGVGAGAWYLGSGRYTLTPSVQGLDQAAATQRMTAAGLTVQVSPTRQFSETIVKGNVVTTNPAPGSRVAKNSAVMLILSNGAERYQVPALSGMTLQQATAALASAHLALGQQTQAYSDKVSAGSVISSSPTSGASERRNTPVDLTVSKGSAPVPVPSFVSLPLAQAQSLAADKHLKLVQSGLAYSTSVPLGAVISQDTPPGTQVDKGTTVNVVVSQGPPLVPVPNVIDRKEATAVRMLEAAGFKVSVNSVPNPTLDRVIAQSGGATAPRGSTIVITIV